MTRIFTRSAAAARILAAVALVGLAPAVAAAQTPDPAHKPASREHRLQPRSEKSGHVASRAGREHRWQVAERDDRRGPSRGHSGQGVHDGKQRDGRSDDDRSRKDGGERRRG